MTKELANFRSTHAFEKSTFEDSRYQSPAILHDITNCRSRQL